MKENVVVIVLYREVCHMDPHFVQKTYICLDIFKKLLTYIYIYTHTYIHTYVHIHTHTDVCI